MAAPTTRGRRGERLAADFLHQRERVRAMVARNWRSPRDRRDELDLVCRDGDALVFVEVKARAATALVPGYHAMDERKKPRAPPRGRLLSGRIAARRPPAHGAF
jgi:putative endonuclease